MGIALRTRWIWLRRAEPEHPWTRVAPLADRKSLHCFAAGSKVLLGNGASTSFWCDNWLPDGGSVQYRFPILFSFVKLSDITVAAALCDNSWIADIRGGLSVQAMGEYLALWDVIAGISLDPGSTDSMIWKAAPNGDFSVRSAYSILSAGRTSCPLGKIIWKSRAPARCKFFMFLAVRNTCLTADNLQRRGWKLAPICHLCSKDGESYQHIFQACTFSQQVWVQVQARLSLSCSPPSSDFAGWWLAARQTVAKIDRKTFDAGVILVTWLIWKERNARVFEGNNLVGHAAIEANGNYKILQRVRCCGAEKKIKEAYNWVQDNRYKFRTEVYGPVFLEVNIQDKAHASYLEGHVPNYIWKMQEVGIYSRLDQVFEAPPAVKDVLISRANFDHSEEMLHEKRKQDEIKKHVVRKRIMLVSIYKKKVTESSKIKFVDQVAKFDQRFQVVLKFKDLLIRAVVLKRSCTQENMASIELDTRCLLPWEKNWIVPYKEIF
ncbi:Os11g0577200 [Oryza sativa Japonica Group]|uniref:Os11g0577200 protein n=1 Tax=Oryza sativa subsp. japonica TaxID=39947 RepID=A0A0P0Y3H7_ORYSJ|nr:Os11g0577200 [Oryza sativa Japonica Group]